MNEIELRFCQEEMKPVLLEFRNQLLINILEHQEELRKQILGSIEKIHMDIDTAKELQEYKVEYINFSLLQIGFLQESYEVDVTAYSKFWFEERGVSERIALPYLFGELTTIKERFLDQAKRYVGKIRRCVIEQYILDELSTYNQFFVYFFMKWFIQLEDETCFMELPKEETVYIAWGDYKDDFTFVYAYDTSAKKEEMFHRLLRRSDEAKLMFTGWRGMQLKDEEISDKNLTGISFREAILEGIHFDQSYLVGANFKDCQLRDCSFTHCDLKLSDFTGSILNRVTFTTCDLTESIWKDAEFQEVDVIENENEEELHTSGVVTILEEVE